MVEQHRQADPRKPGLSWPRRSNSAARCRRLRLLGAATATGQRLSRQSYPNLAKSEPSKLSGIRSQTLAADPHTTQASLVKAIRDEVDKYLITSNHWHGSRELFHAKPSPRDIEHHQHILSDTFGEIHTNTFYGGSPVCYVRDVAVSEGQCWDKTTGTYPYSGSWLYWLKMRLKSWSAKEQTAYCLQVGGGHCGEHAMVCYSIMVDAMRTDAKVMSKVVNIVRSGNASIDHAFCVVGMNVNTIWHDVRTQDWGQGRSLVKKGEEIVIWDLKEAIHAEGQSGVVMDAYLGDLQRATAAGLLKKIQGAPENTHYVSFHEQYPYTGGVHKYPTVTDPDLKKDI